MSPEQAHIEAADVPPTSGIVRRTTTEDLYAEHWAFVLKLVCSTGIQRQEVDDVAQDAWLVIHDRLAANDVGTEPDRAWVVGVVLDCAAKARRTFRRWKREKLARAPDEAATSHTGDPAPAYALKQALAALETAIPNPDQRLAYVLRHAHGCTIREIAKATKTPQRTVEWRIRMAESDLRAKQDSGALLAFGFASLDVFRAALKPAEPDFETGAQLWRSIEAAIKPKALSLGLKVASVLIAALVLAAFVGALPGPKQSALVPDPDPEHTVKERVTQRTENPERPEPTKTARTDIVRAFDPAEESQRVILRMRIARARGDRAEVCRLAGEHKRRFGAIDEKDRGALFVLASCEKGR